MIKTLTCSIFFTLLLANCYSQPKPSMLSNSFDSIANKFDKQRRVLWRNKNFESAIVLMKGFYSDYSELDSITKKRYKGNIETLFYNLSCAYSLLDQKDSSINYLQVAIDNGFSDYHLIMQDSDLINIHNEKKFRVIVDSLATLYDYEIILRQYLKYNKESKLIPKYTYESPEASGLMALREKYHLDSIAGNGSEISKIINLMSWVHKTVRHDGNSSNPKDRHAESIIELCKKENRGVNCRMLATILNEIYLSVGFKSHFVTCLPKNKNDNDCHVINAVFSNEVNKWIWVDPSFETWVKDEKDNLLSIEEVRYRLIKGLPVFASPNINWNGQPYGGGGEAYLHDYMSKNLFQVNIPLNSCAAFESQKEVGSMVLKDNPPIENVYIQLISADYKPEKIELGKVVNGVYFTNDSEQFWKKPE